MNELQLTELNIENQVRFALGLYKLMRKYNVDFSFDEYPNAYFRVGKNGHLNIGSDWTNQDEWEIQVDMDGSRLLQDSLSLRIARHVFADKIASGIEFLSGYVKLVVREPDSEAFWRVTAMARKQIEPTDLQKKSGFFGTNWNTETKTVELHPKDFDTIASLLAGEQWPALAGIIASELASEG